MNKEQLIQGIYNEYMGKRDQALAELQVYLDSPAGVGEHGGIADVVKEKIERVSNLNGLADTMRTLFMGNSPDEKVSGIAADDVSLPNQDLEQS